MQWLAGPQINPALNIPHSILGEVFSPHKLLRVNPESRTAFDWTYLSYDPYLPYWIYPVIAGFLFCVSPFMAPYYRVRGNRGDDQNNEICPARLCLDYFMLSTGIFFRCAQFQHVQCSTLSVTQFRTLFTGLKAVFCL